MVSSHGNGSTLVKRSVVTYELEARKLRSSFSLSFIALLAVGRKILFTVSLKLDFINIYKSSYYTIWLWSCHIHIP